MVICIEEKEIEVTYKELLNGVPLSKLKGTKLYDCASVNQYRNNPLKDRTITIDEIRASGMLYGIETLYYVIDDRVGQDSLINFVLDVIVNDFKVTNLEVLRDELDSDIKERYS